MPFGFGRKKKTSENQNTGEIRGEEEAELRRRMKERSDQGPYVPSSPLEIPR